MTPPSISHPPAGTAPLDAEREERLATLVEVLSEVRGAGAQAALERLAGDHPDLAGELRGVFAAMSVADAVAEHSTMLGTADPA